MMRPIIAPKAMMIAMWPRVLPMPPSMVATRSAGFTPGDQGHHDADQHQRDERLEFVLEDQKQQQRDT